MVEGAVEAVWDDLYGVVGEDLRVVTRYEGVDYETRMREDVREQYTTREDRVVVDDTVIKQIDLQDTEGAFKTGRLEAVVRVFEDAWVASVPDDVGRKSGYVVSVERGGEASMDDLEACLPRIRDREPGE